MPPGVIDEEKSTNLRTGNEFRRTRESLAGKGLLINSDLCEGSLQRLRSRTEWTINDCPSTCSCPSKTNGQTVLCSSKGIRVVRFKRLPKRTVEMDLRGNHIEYIEPGSFANLPSLVRLYLQVNQLREVQKDTFSGLRNIKHFELDGNDIICDCDIRWLVMRSRNRKRGPSLGSKCKYPKQLAGTRLKSLGGRSWNCKDVDFEMPGFNILPVHSQVVFQNDSIQLTCSSMWQPRGRLEWVVKRHSLLQTSVTAYGDMNTRENKSVLLIKRSDLHHSGDYLCRAVISNAGEMAKPISLTVIGWQTKFCVLQRTSSDKGTFFWRSTVAGAVATSSCPFGDKKLAHRRCANDGEWESADTSNCLFKNVLTRELEALFKRDVNETSLNQILLDLGNIIETYKRNITENVQIELIANLFAEMGTMKVVSRSRLERVRASIASMITDFMSRDSKTLGKNEQEDGDMTNRLLAVLEKFMMDSLDREIRDSAEDTPVVLPVTSSVAAFSRSYRPGHPQSLVCNALFKNATYPDTGVLGECSEYTNKTSRIEGIDVQLVIPSVVFSLSMGHKFNSSSQLTNVTFIAYKTARLFADSNLQGIESRTVNTTINSAVIGVRVQVPGMNNADIVTSESLLLMFKHFKMGHNPRLVYWSGESAGVRKRWKINNKCKLVTEAKTFSKFMCSELLSHMTYFTVIMEIKKEAQLLATFELEFVTHVGAGICAFFLLLTFFTYAAFRELRYNRNDAATLMNLCLALIVAVLLFVTGINRIENQLLCKAFAVLLHYFILCCLLWVGCGGACMTVLVKKGPDKEEYNPVLKYYLISWGLPMIVCGITLAGNVKNYNATTYCWLTSQASIGAFIIPGGLVLIINIIIFLRLHALVNRKYPEHLSRDEPDNNLLSDRNSRASNMRKSDFHFPDRGELLDFVKGSLLVMLILCIDCGFVVMIFVNRDGSSRYLYHLFSYGFAISNMILGLSMFIFHCVRREDVHVCWKSLFHGKRALKDVPIAAENEILLESANDAIKSSQVRNESGVSAMISERNNDHSDVISALSLAQSHFTHDVPSSRPSSIFGPSAGDPKLHNRHGIGKLTLPSYENTKPVQRASGSESAQNPAVPSAPPLPLTGFAAYPPSTLPETVTQFNERPVNSTMHNAYTPDFTITTVSERTFSDTSNLHSDARPVAKQQETPRENFPSEQSSNVDPASRSNNPAILPLRGIVAPNWKPVRHGGSSAVFYPYVDPGFKALQSPGPNSLNSVLTSVSSAQTNVLQATGQGDPLPTIGAFTIPQRSEVIGAASSNKPLSNGSRTEEEQTVSKLQSETETKIESDIQASSIKTEKTKRTRSSNRRRRVKSKTRFEDLPVEKCLVYVPLMPQQEKPIPSRNETSV
eukprot:gene12554-3247_t